MAIASAILERTLTREGKSPREPQPRTMSSATQSSAPSSTAVAPVRDPRLEISNRMVRLHKQAFGRGPTQCRALFPDPHSLIVLLEETLTVSERNLVAMGEVERLTDARIFVQSKLEPEARAIVEDALQRRTRAFIAGLDPRRDIATYFFTLEPMDTTEAGTAAGPARSRRAHG